MKTINLKGKSYAPVSARVEQFHKDHNDGCITTETTFTNGYVIVKATVSFGIIYRTNGSNVSDLNDVSSISNQIDPLFKRTFTGHSYGQTKGEKAFEKLETTAVGRALAFAGYLAGGEIASYDEMQEFVDESAGVAEACDTLTKATNLDELKTAFESLPENVKGDNEVIAKKDELKQELS